MCETRASYKQYDELQNNMVWLSQIAVLFLKHDLSWIPIVAGKL